MSIPLTVLGGYLGAGKTTFLNALLSRPEVPRVGVLVNDFGSINVDAKLIRNASGTTMGLANGCVCCSIAGDLGVALEHMRNLDVEQVIIEASGVAQPARIADYGHSSPGYRLGTILTAVNAQTLPALRKDRYVGSLIEGQMQQADLLLVTRLDLLTDAAGESLMATLPKPAVRSTQGQTPGNLLLAHRDPSWPSATNLIRADAETTSDHATFTSLSIDEPAALRYESLPTLLTGLASGLLRMKGWITDELGRHWVVQLAGGRWSLEPELHPDHEAGCRLLLIARAGSIDLDALQQRILSVALDLPTSRAIPQTDI